MTSWIVIALQFLPSALFIAYTVDFWLWRRRWKRYWEQERIESEERVRVLREMSEEVLS